MKFVSIPTSGMSWSGVLAYSFDTELDEATDVDIGIFDAQTDEVIATKRLYGVVAAEVDIAPILRSISDSRIVLGGRTSIMTSPLSRQVVVEIMGVRSEARVFCAVQRDITKAELLSRIPTGQTVSRNDLIVFSVAAPDTLTMRIEAHTSLSMRTYNFSKITGSMPCDVVINVRDYSRDVNRIVLYISNVGEEIGMLTYNVVDNANTGRVLMWRNWQGGIESYRFPRHIPITQGATVDRFATHDGVEAILRSATLKSRLCSAMERSDEIERISQIVFAPYVYELKNQKLTDVELVTRSIDRSKHGELQTIALDICSEWKGGES